MFQDNSLIGMCLAAEETKMEHELRNANNQIRKLQEELQEQLFLQLTDLVVKLACVDFFGVDESEKVSGRGSKSHSQASRSWQ